MTLHEAAALLREVRHPSSDLARDLALSRLVLVAAKALVAEHGGDEREAAKGLTDLVKLEVVRWG
jgi:hypothetical protein